MSGSRRDSFIPVAGQIPFDNATNGFTADDTQAAIEELKNTLQASASPGFSYGRTGVCSGGTYMQCETVPSNVSGRWVYISNAVVKNVYVTNENTLTYSMTATYHDGNGANEVVLGTVTVTSAKGAAIPVNWPVPTNKQIAVKVANATAGSPKNVVVGLELAGTI
jgi:hypothetical protein